ncbi:unnamed protein product [Ectocarpus fasciculatus]
MAPSLRQVWYPLDACIDNNSIQKFSDRAHDTEKQKSCATMVLPFRQTRENLTLQQRHPLFEKKDLHTCYEECGPCLSKGHTALCSHAPRACLSTAVDFTIAIPSTWHLWQQPKPKIKP